MAVYLSPGVFPREIDLSTLPINQSPIIPAFIGTAKRGPMNTPTYVSSAEQYIETFGEPFAESYLGYAVLSFMAEGNAAWVVRIGVECRDGQSDALADVCIDTSGTNIQGWGRIPLFGGIDYGRISLRAPTVDLPLAFHPASVDNISYNDAELSGTYGASGATITFTGSGLTDAYADAIDDSFILLITGDPEVSSASVIQGATYEITRNSDGIVISSGTLSAATSTTSNPIGIGTGADDTGLVGRITNVTGVPLGVGDTFTFEAHPDNRFFNISVEGDSPVTYQMSTASYTTSAAFVTAFNAIVAAAPYQAVTTTVSSVDTLQLITETAGEYIQVTGTEGWALEVGVTKWAYDIPRSYVQATDGGTFNISTSNDRTSWEVISGTAKTRIDVSLPVGNGQTADTIAAALHAGAVTSGTRLFKVIALQTTDALQYVTAITDATNHKYSQLKLMVDFSHSETINFADELGVRFPYTNKYRVFSDTRVSLPEPGVVTPATPLICESDPSGSQCTADSAYYANIVGFLVATSAGTWATDWTVTLENFAGNAGRYELSIYDSTGAQKDRVQDFTFDPRDDNYIGNVVNPGTSLGGTNGNKYINWEERPSYLDNDSTVDGFEPRVPGLFAGQAFAGMANGIPEDAASSTEIDAAIIGNPATGSGMQSLTNTDRFDISLLIIPGNSSGSVIGNAIQFCEGRGDCILLVDPPFGLRPQQVVDWHNGILYSDLANSLNSSYAALYWSWVKVFDQFNRTEIFIPPSGLVASVFARTARVAETWTPPAGLNRGRLLTALDLEYNPTQGDRDLLYGYNNAVNPITNFHGDGIVVFGQRTLQRRDSALDRVNVRMLMIALKKSLRVLLRQFLFEPNDRFLWAQVRNVINSFMADVAARRGVTAFKVIVDATNNTPERIDRNELWVSVLLKPTRAAEFVALNLAVLRTDQSFAAEEVLQAAGVV